VEQLSFFEPSGQSAGLPTDLLEYHAGFFNAAEGKAFLYTFINTIPWIQEDIPMYGKLVKTPRLTAWFGDKDKEYIFSGTKHYPNP